MLDTDESVIFSQYAILSDCNSGQCAAMLEHDASVMFRQEKLSFCSCGQ